MVLCIITGGLDFKYKSEVFTMSPLHTHWQQLHVKLDWLFTVYNVPVLHCEVHETTITKLWYVYTRAWMLKLIQIWSKRFLCFKLSYNWENEWSVMVWYQLMAFKWLRTLTGAIFLTLDTMNETGTDTDTGIGTCTCTFL